MSRNRRNDRGSATLLVLTLTRVMAALLTVMGTRLQQLRDELQQIDRKQQERFNSQPPGSNPR